MSRDYSWITGAPHELGIGLRETSLTKEQEVSNEDNAEETGVIQKSTRESLIYFDHVLPFRQSKVDFKQDIYATIFSKNNKTLQDNVLDLSASENGPLDKSKLQITSFVPIKRDGGVFVKFAVPPFMEIDEFNKAIQKNTKDKATNSILGYLTHPRCYPVKGVPWIEDLRRFPSNRLKMSFEGPDLTEEEIYLLMRRYGVISDIIPPSPSIKDLPRFAEVKFRSMRSAVAAKNCTTGLKLGETVIHIKYIPVVRDNIIKDLILGHTKIAIPIIIALLATLAVLIFDPIRELFVESKITKKYLLTTYKDNLFVKPLISFINTFYDSVSSVAHLFYTRCGNRNEESGVLWTERYETVKQVKLWMEENMNTFLIIQGPRGSGKHLLIKEHVLAARDNVLYLDCEMMIKSRNETQLIRNVSHELGYYPIFPWLNSISTYIDLGVQGLTGQKSGLAESKETQVKNMFALVTSTIRNIALRDYNLNAVLEPEVDENGVVVAQTLIKEDDYLTDNPELKPVVVIDRFATKSETNSFVYRELAEFAATLINMNVAHVIFITDEVGSTQVLTEALPNLIFKTFLLSDALEESAQSYVLTQLKNSGKDFSELSQIDLCRAVKPLGGRMLDLQALVRRIVSGEEPQVALSQMVHQTAEQVTQMIKSLSAKYTQAQAWEMVKMLAAKPSVGYNEIYKSAFFKDTATLVELERDELVMLIKDQGIVQEVRPGKPLFTEAFCSLVNNERVYSFFENDSLSLLIAMETAKVKRFEEELVSLRAVSDNKLFAARLEYLGQKICLSTDKIIALEAAQADLLNRLEKPTKKRSSWL
ncbi:hypothetical protein BABINDRAFT_178866 [Babjeviella inositovora NRRL Y-12698]|uniref:Mitochondrial escape protein 2 n=1 Tax=Babjeviella inositovora NRRL Y-12698 TaxID=984486 RepID=A0A1E3R049_9ASCO|nr:uncharacterized protein BABINDRAFT_178866 [Babjeviella inositovora NRRL Y-12698]ODQ82722.1 hypothetical protein BABINDRAFT_178866 [Babjeviella inositovora NRRL Y-12698]